MESLRKGPSIIFQHLLGLDSNSHAHGGPGSKQYLDNIVLVDGIVAETVALMEDAFPDSRTAYLLTADHGCVTVQAGLLVPKFQK